MILYEIEHNEQTKKINLLLLLLSIAGIMVGYSIIFPERVGLCVPNSVDRSCELKFPSSELGEPLYWGSVALASIFLILLFVPREVFKTWRKFAVPYIILATLLIAITPVHGNLATPNREQVTWWLSGLYVILSLIVILYRHIRLRKTKA